ncbi:MAG: selenium-binding protein SBP56-related protein [Gemmatimonadota bacterium]
MKATKSTWKPDPTFYASPSLAAEAPRERLAYVALLNVNGGSDAIGVVDLDEESPTRGELVGRFDMPEPGDELHHFGWNACSSHLCPWAPHAHVERRYLVVPGIHSSNIYILDTKDDPRNPKLVKTIPGAELKEKTGYSAPHTVHCGPDGIYLNGLGNAEGGGPGGIFVIDHETFELRPGQWEKERGPQFLSYDFAWHLGHDTIVTSEWGTPEMVAEGVNPELLLAGEYGNALHVWDMRKRRHLQKLELGPQYQMSLELRPARDPRKAYGFAGVVLSLEDLSASIWLWYRDGMNGSSEWKVKKVIDIPADVSDPFDPKLTGSVRIGGIVDRAPHPTRPDRPLNGGPQMVEVSRDGRRIYVTNSLYSPWDEQFYPDGIRGWMARFDARREGGLRPDETMFVQMEEGIRPHQVRLQGGDASSDSFCYS